MEITVGKVHTTGDTPSPTRFFFVVEKGKVVEKGQFVAVDESFGKVIALVENVVKSNRYFSKPEAAIEGERLERIFPVEEWEFLIGEARPLAVLRNGQFERPSLPVTPGSEVKIASEELLFNFIGLDQRGLYLGKLWKHEVPLKVNLSKLLQKHLAILAMSGAGKSYLASVLIEELLERPKELGRIAIAVIDTHGEYVSFAEPPPHGVEAVDYSSRAYHVVDMKIPVPELDSGDFLALLPDISSPQRRLLDLAISKLRETEPVYGIRELISMIQRVKLNLKVDSKVVNALKNKLEFLEFTGLFGEREILKVKDYNTGEVVEKNLAGVMEPGKAAIFDLSSRLNTRDRQIMVYWIARKIFWLRRQNKIPPALILVEEAHNYIPQTERKENIPSRGILETISREGRKFMCSLCVISQRPVRLSTTVLSQCNTQIILRITNPSDLEQIKQSSEGITKEAINALTTLQTGDALIVGEAVRIPVFFKVRKRKSWEKAGLNMEDAAKAWEESSTITEKEIEAYMGGEGFEV